MEIFLVKYIKDGFRYETEWESESLLKCIEEIESHVLKGKSDYNLMFPRNAILTVKREGNYYG